jgi:hypothetical protein
MKRLHQSTLIGQQGINLIEQIVLRMGYSWNPTNLDAGIDGYIELRDSKTGEVSNNIIQVQSKATEQPLDVDNGNTFEFHCSEKDLEYWLAGNAPVILVRSRPKTGEAYWIPVKEYFRDMSARKSRKIIFHKERNRFDEGSRDALTSLAVADSGLYLGAIPKLETIYSNLLQLSPFPQRYFVADSRFRTAGEIYARLNELTTRAAGEWLLNNKRIFSFHDLGVFPWDRICDVGTMDELDTEAWSQTKDVAEQRLFVQLLNACLRNKLFAKGVIFSRENEYYFFRPTQDLRDLEYAYQSRENRTSRFVFKSYPKKKDQTQIAYYRHSAFDGRFVRYGDRWFLQITPTYHYTFDGRRPYFYASDQLSGIKRLENNAAVHGQVVMWGSLLTERSLFDKTPNFVSFTPFAEFNLDAGFEDSLWLDREEPEKLSSLLADEDNQPKLL